MSTSTGIYGLWVLLASTAVTLEVFARCRRGRLVRFSQVARQALARRSVWMITAVIWMWAGWHLFAR